MSALRCLIFGHVWTWVQLRELWGCADYLACARCGRIPAKPFGDAVECGR